MSGRNDDSVNGTGTHRLVVLNLSTYAVRYISPATLERVPQVGIGRDNGLSNCRVNCNVRCTLVDEDLDGRGLEGHVAEESEEGKRPTQMTERRAPPAQMVTPPSRIPPSGRRETDPALYAVEPRNLP